MKANKCAAASSALLGAMRHNIFYLAATITLRNVSIAAAITIQSQVLAFAQSELGEDPSEIIRKLPRNLVVLAPEYPAKARENRVSGEVILEFSLTDDGHARDIMVVKSEPPGIFESAVLGTLPSWLFLPDVKTGCFSRTMRSRQHVFFEWKDGRALFSFDPLVDVPPAKGSPGHDYAGSNTMPTSSELKETALASSEKHSSLRFKEPPIVEYPIEARKVDAQAYIFSKYEVTTEGNIENIDFPFVIAKETAKSRLLAALRRGLRFAKIETVDGTPPPKRTVICQSFAFTLR